jgi:hypothetical protein
MKFLLVLLCALFGASCYTFEYDPPGGEVPDMNEPDESEPDMPVEEMLPVITITLPRDNAQVTSPVRLVAVAADVDQNDISSGIVWLQNETPFKTGSDVTHEFPVGEHTVSARATDSKGRTGESFITFEVIGN